MRPRAFVIANRNARGLARGGGVLRALREAERSGIAEVHETRTLDDLERAAEAARGEPRAIVLAGGDGSYLAGATALFHAFGGALPPLGLVPGGTVATVARNWGFRGGAEAYTRRLMSAIGAGSPGRATRPTLSALDESGRPRIGFIFGAGLVSGFFDAYYEANAPGYVTAARLVARIFAGSFVGGALAKRVLSPTPCTLRVDGEPQPPRAWSLIAASVVSDLGLHMRLLYRAGERRDAFHAVASPLPPRALGPQLGRVLRGRALTGDGHVDRMTRELIVEFPETSTYVLDGDRFHASRVVLRAGPTFEQLMP